MLAEHPNSHNGQWGLRTKRSLAKKVSNVGEHTYFPQDPTLSQTTPFQMTTSMAYSARGRLCLDEVHNNSFIKKIGCKVIKRRVNMMIDELVEDVD